MDKYQVLYNKSDFSFSVIERLDGYFVVLVSNIEKTSDAHKVADALNAKEASNG
jgi:hypothetical protein